MNHSEYNIKRYVFDAVLGSHLKRTRNRYIGTLSRIVRHSARKNQRVLQWIKRWSVKHSLAIIMNR